MKCMTRICSGKHSLLKNWMRRRVARKLALSPQQTQQFISFQQRLDSERDSWQQQRRHTHAALGTLLEGNRLDRQRATTLLEEKCQAAQTHGSALVDAFGDFFDSLEPWQRQRLQEHWQRRHCGCRSH